MWADHSFSPFNVRLQIEHSNFSQFFCSTWLVSANFVRIFLSRSALLTPIKQAGTPTTSQTEKQASCRPGASRFSPKKNLEMMSIEGRYTSSFQSVSLYHSVIGWEGHCLHCRSLEPLCLIGFIDTFLHWFQSPNTINRLCWERNHSVIDPLNLERLSTVQGESKPTCCLAYCLVACFAFSIHPANT